MSVLDDLILDFDIDKPHAMKTRHVMANNARAELAALRAKAAMLDDCAAQVAAQAARIAWLTTDVGESGLAAINRLIAACERSDIGQQAAPDLGIARDAILRQARELNEARKARDEWRLMYIKLYHSSNKHPVDHPAVCTACLQLLDRLDGALAAHPAPAAEPQP